MFSPFQTLPTVKAFDVQPFKIGDDTYLAVAIYYGRGSHIFKWDGQRFVKFQEIAAVGADVEHFKMNGSTYLAITGTLFVELRNGNQNRHVFTKVQTLALVLPPTDMSSRLQANISVVVPLSYSLSHSFFRYLIRYLTLYLTRLVNISLGISLVCCTHLCDIEKTNCRQIP